MIQKIKYLPFTDFVVRTPLLSFNQLDDMFSRLANSEQELKEIIQNKIILEAIYLGSPVLYQEIQKYLGNKLPDQKEENRLRDSVLRYISRMSTRCTPFGLFAGCSMGSIGEKTNFTLDNIAKYDRHTRLDMNYLCALSQDIAKLPTVKQATLFFPNTSVYEYGDQLRYVEYKYIKTRRIHSIVSVDNSEYIQNVLNRARTGAQLQELAELLVDDEITQEEARTFIDELVDSQVIVNELEPAITGKEYFEQLLEILDRIPELEDLKIKLRVLDKLIKEIDVNPIGETQDYYNQIIELVNELKTDYDIKYLFQSDMTKPCQSSTISTEIIDEIYAGLIMMNKLSPKYPAQTFLSRFAESFQERYESQSIQLLKVLDTELGIGYRPNSGYESDINPLVDDLFLPQKTNPNTEIQWDPIQAFMHRKFMEANAEKSTTIVLNDKDFEKLSPDWDNLPVTISAMCEVFAYNENNKLIYLHSAGGSSAANLLGRFCHTNNKLHEHVLNITQKEEEFAPDVILAEIVHLPESRIGNILLRPILRKYEIPYLAKSAVDDEFQLPLSDLYISVSSNTVKLFSRRLNKHIIPRLSSAHNFSFGSMPVYNFLCDLQTQNLRGGIGFSWGSLADEYLFLPRVMYKNLIFSLARWTIKVSDLKVFMDINDESEQMKKINQWKADLKIPRYALMPDGDNELFVDFDNRISIQTLYSVIKKRSHFFLNEFPFHKDEAIVRDVNGNAFTNEFLFAFYKSVIQEETRKK